MFRWTVSVGAGERSQCYSWMRRATLWDLGEVSPVPDYFRYVLSAERTTGCEVYESRIGDVAIICRRRKRKLHPDIVSVSMYFPIGCHEYREFKLFFREEDLYQFAAKWEEAWHLLERTYPLEPPESDLPNVKPQESNEAFVDLFLMPIGPGRATFDRIASLDEKRAVGFTHAFSDFNGVDELAWLLLHRGRILAEPDMIELLRRLRDWYLMLEDPSIKSIKRAWSEKDEPEAFAPFQRLLLEGLRFIAAFPDSADNRQALLQQAPATRAAIRALLVSLAGG